MTPAASYTALHLPVSRLSAMARRTTKTPTALKTRGLLRVHHYTRYTHLLWLVAHRLPWVLVLPLPGLRTTLRVRRFACGSGLFVRYMPLRTYSFWRGGIYPLYHSPHLLTHRCYTSIPPHTARDLFLPCRRTPGALLCIARHATFAHLPSSQQTKQAHCCHACSFLPHTTHIPHLPGQNIHCAIVFYLFLFF